MLLRELLMISKMHHYGNPHFILITLIRSISVQHIPIIKFKALKPQDFEYVHNQERKKEGFKGENKQKRLEI